MFCPDCGEQVQKSYRFCPKCGFKLYTLTQNKTKDVATSAHQPSATAGEKNQKEDKDQGPKGVKEEKVNPAQIKGQPESDDVDAARCGATSQDSSDNTASTATSEKEATHSPPNKTLSDGESVSTKKTQETSEEEGSSASAHESECQPYSERAPGPNVSVSTNKLTEQQTEASSDINTEDSPGAVQIPADKLCDINPGPLSNSVSSLTSTKEIGSTAPETAEKIPQECNSVANQCASVKDKDETISHTTQDLSNKIDASNGQCAFAKKTDRKDQAARDKRLNSDDLNTNKSEYPADPCQVVYTKSNEKTNTCLTERQEQQPGNRDVDVSRSPTPASPPSQSDEKAMPLVGENISKTFTELQALQTVPSSECVPVYFHAVTSKDCHLDPEKDLIFLMSAKLFGDWNNCGKQMSFTWSLGEQKYLVEQQVMIPKYMIHETIPYKYLIYKHSENCFIYETIYDKNANQLINRCLDINHEFLTHEGEWHQYDDVIYRKLKKSTWLLSSTEDIVVKGRDEAGRVMLNIIFDLLTSWNEPNVENFFLLLQQFFYTYSYPVLHDGMKRPWGLPYGEEQVKKLLKCVLEERVNPKPRKQKEPTKFLIPLYAGVVSLLIHNKYLENDMADQLSNLCDLLCLQKQPQQPFLSFWKGFASSLPDKKSVADVVEILCNKARQCHNEKWVLVIPLIHLLREESKPFEPVPAEINPQFESWSGLRYCRSSKDGYVRYVSVFLLQRFEHL
ncbi:E3 ubiquitin-protein ligase rnf213-alpha [Plectropomus leopardus]|uniref:E3 ubiquitin-protein ligase rnf213-alpha n=1 Tax=Plectropomus leopardus TaxID=160734 RepID=UPI001C4CD471|nr:E3 ubiquitin-protein ligase rnf213-alpha [Plectropomus leopardus]